MLCSSFCGSLVLFISSLEIDVRITSFFSFSLSSLFSVSLAILSLISGFSCSFCLTSFIKSVFLEAFLFFFKGDSSSFFLFFLSLPSTALKGEFLYQDYCLHRTNPSCTPIDAFWSAYVWHGMFDEERTKEEVRWERKRKWSWWNLVQKLSSILES